MQTSWRTELPQLLLIIAMFVVASLAWSYVPEQVPVHWNIHGEVDRYGGRFEGLFVLPLIAAAMYVLLRLLPKIDPRAANYLAFAKPYLILRSVLIVFMAVIHLLLLSAALGRPLAIGTVVPALVGILLVVIGTLMSRIKPNWFVGVRTPWTLSSELSWTKTHRLASWLLPLSGVAMILAGLLRTEWAFYSMLAVLPGSAIILIVYSYFVWRDDPSRN